MYAFSCVFLTLKQVIVHEEYCIKNGKTRKKKSWVHYGFNLGSTNWSQVYYLFLLLNIVISSLIFIFKMDRCDLRK